MARHEEEVDTPRVVRFVSGQASEIEAAQIRAAAAADPRLAEELRSLHGAWSAAGVPEPEFDTSVAWDRVEERIRASERRRRWVLPMSWLGATLSAARNALAPRAPTLAGATLVLVAILAAYAALARFGGSPPGPMQELVTRKGERAEFRLADGTRVTVGPESRLHVPVRFGSTAREVHLSGQAFFDVTADRARPFRVHAGGAVTEVLGTEFNVRAYPEELEVAVVVAEGRVQLRPENARGGAVLTPGEIGEVAADSAMVRTRRVDVDQHLGWHQGRLVFDRTPLARVCADLERWYGIPVRVADPALGTLRVTASFTEQPLDEVVALIAASLELAHSRRGRTIVFLPKRTAVHHVL